MILLHSHKIEITKKIYIYLKKYIYSESIFHADFKSKEFTIEYLCTTSEKLNMKKKNPFIILLSHHNLELLLGKKQMENAVTCYLYEALCRLISNQESSPLNISTT